MRVGQTLALFCCNQFYFYWCKGHFPPALICLILLVSFKMIWHIIACHCFEVNTKMASLVLPDQFKISLTFWDISNIDLFSLMLLLQMFTHQTPVVNLNLTIWLSCLTLVVCDMTRLVECSSHLLSNTRRARQPDGRDEISWILSCLIWNETRPVQLCKIQLFHHVTG